MDDRELSDEMAEALDRELSDEMAEAQEVPEVTASEFVDAALNGGMTYFDHPSGCGHASEEHQAMADEIAANLVRGIAKTLAKRKLRRGAINAAIGMAFAVATIALAILSVFSASDGAWDRATFLLLAAALTAGGIRHDWLK